MVDRLRGTLLSMFPALERTLDVTNTGPLKLLTGHQTVTVLGAEFLAAVGCDRDDFDSPDVLAAFAGVAPAPHDSGKVSGNLHRPVAHHRTFCGP